MIKLTRILIGDTCFINNPLHLDVVSIDNESFSFIDNQWEIDMLIKMNPSFERERLTNNSKYHEILDLNTYLRRSNNGRSIEFNKNQFGIFETTETISINGKEESVKFYIRPVCNIKKPMNIRLVETNYDDKYYYAFIDNQWKYRIDYSSVSSQYKKYVRFGKTFQRETQYQIGVFEYEDFCTIFNEGKTFEFEHVHSFWVSYSELKAIGSTAIATLYANENLDKEQPIIVELYQDTYSNKITGTLKNVYEIIEL